MIATAVLLLLPVLLLPVRSLIELQPCSDSPEPKLLQYVTEFSNELTDDAREKHPSLSRQLVVNPCVDLEYYGFQIQTSRVLTIYGTCDYEQMFRFSARISALYGCWQAELTVWNRSEPGKCGWFQDKSTITLHSYVLFMNILVDVTGERSILNTTHITLQSTEFYYSIPLSERYRNAYFQYNDARIGQCRCNSTGRPSQAEFWHRHCERPVARPKSSKSVFRWAIVTGAIMVGLCCVVAVSLASKK